MNKNRRGKLFFVENPNGMQFAVRVLTKGDKYGRNRCLTWENEQNGIEFYDCADAGSENFDPLGNFTGGRYFIETIIDHEGGLSLMGDVPAWAISADNMEKIQSWLYKQGWA